MPEELKDKIKNIWMFLVLITIIFQNNSVAQEKQNTWDLSRCIEYAKNNNITLKNLRLNVSSDEQDLKLSKNEKWPDLNAGVSQNLSYSNSSKGFTNSSFGVNSSVVLYNGNYYNNSIKSNGLLCQEANLNVEAGENDITIQITQAYLNILLANENIEYLKDLVQTSTSQVVQCQEKYNAGSVALKDLMQLQSALANDKYSLVVAENNKRQNIMTLKKILQIPPDTIFDVAIPEKTDVQVSLFSLEEVQKYAIQNMPEMKSSELEISRQKVELQKAKAGFLPKLSLSGSLNSGFGSYFSSTSDPYFTQLSDKFTPQMGLSLSIPILNHNSSKINVEKSKIRIEQAQLESENTRTELMQIVEQAYIDVENAQNQYVAAGEQLNYAKESYRISKEQQSLGANNNVEFLQQKNLYIQAQQTYIQTKYTLMLHLKIYNFYKGIPVTEQ